MLPFFIQHIDALLTALGGLFCCYFGYHASRPGTTTAQQRATKFLRIGGPVLVLVGLVRFVTDQPTQPTTTTWKRHTTSDGMASVEFPGPPKTTEQMDIHGPISVRRTSLIYQVPFIDVSLHLSFSPLVPGEKDLTDAERIAAMKEMLTQNGFLFTLDSPTRIGTVSGFALDFQRDGGKIRSWMRIAIVKGKIYRVVVSSEGAFHNDPVINHFLESFRIEEDGAK